tara:strand:- start:3247 stop:4866 length:1620 start_codon:yes stop_codon:yes gene_type:complete
MHKVYDRFDYFTNKFRKFIVLIVFILIALTSIFNLKNFGVAQDEYFSRSFGFINLNYVGQKFIPEQTIKFKSDKNIPNLNNFEHNYYNGAIFDATLSFLEILFNIKDKKNQFLLRHVFISCFFYLSLIFFYKVCNKIFTNWRISLCGVLILFLSPRIFADSFYNNKDILFMSSNIFSLFFFLEYIKYPKIRNAVLLSFFISLSICFRVMGILFPVIFFIFYILSNSNLKNNFYDPLKKTIIPVLLSLLFTYSMWPYLWENPIQNFYYAFAEIKQYNHGGHNLYFGNIIESNKTPWHYSLIWILISTPIIYIVLFFCGVFRSTQSNDKQKKLSHHNNINIVLYCSLSIITLSLVLIILLNSTLYNGWRHLYFIYPFIIFVALFGLEFILIFFNKIKIKLFIIFIMIFSLLDVAIWMKHNNPYQYVFFNILGKKIDPKNFDLDYWGLSYHQNLNYLLENENFSNAKIWNSSQTKLFYSLFSLNEKNRNKFIEVTNIKDADYWITNYYMDKTIYDEKFFLNYDLVNSIVVDGVIINSVFKKK